MDPSVPHSARCPALDSLHTRRHSMLINIFVHLTLTEYSLNYMWFYQSCDQNSSALPVSIDIVHRKLQVTKLTLKRAPKGIFNDSANCDES